MRDKPGRVLRRVRTYLCSHRIVQAAVGRAKADVAGTPEALDAVGTVAAVKDEEARLTPMAFRREGRPSIVRPSCTGRRPVRMDANKGTWVCIGILGRPVTAEAGGR